MQQIKKSSIILEIIDTTKYLDSNWKRITEIKRFEKSSKLTSLGKNWENEKKKTCENEIARKILKNCIISACRFNINPRFDKCRDWGL